MLVRAGCWGQGPTRQPDIPEELPTDQGHVVLIKHYDILTWIDYLHHGDYEIQALILVRAPHPNACSMLLNGHQKSYRAALKNREEVIAQNTVLCYENHVPIEFLPYEELGFECFQLMRRLGLRRDNVSEPLDLEGQDAPDQFVGTMNLRHYMHDATRTD